MALAWTLWLFSGAPAEAQSADGDPLEAAETSVHVRVGGYGRPRLELHRLDGQLDAPLCELPCELDLAPDAYTFGVSRDDAEVVRPDHSLFDLRQDTSLRIAYRSHSALRVGGWIMFAAGGASGSAMVVAGMFFDWAGLALIALGGGLIAFSLVHWLVNAFRNDHVDITAEPLTVTF